jgi:hypothetical protein
MPHAQYLVPALLPELPLKFWTLIRDRDFCCHTFCHLDEHLYTCFEVTCWQP